MTHRIRRIAFGGSIAFVTLLAALAALAPNWLDAACCYFAARDKDINQPGQKAFIQWHPDEGIESFTVQPKFEGNALDFGMVIPTPSQPKLDEMPRDFFQDLAIYTILLPLPEPLYNSLLPQPMEEGVALAGAPGGGVWKEDRNDGVQVLESGVVGSLDYKIIVAQKADGLFEWLKANQYVYSGDEATLDFYIKKQWFFTVMKIDPKQMKVGKDGSYAGEVTPTRFTFESKQCIYPLKITQISVKDVTDALFYVQAPAQMDLQSDWSWMHSWRVMYLTYVLGCAGTPTEQEELNQRNRWIEARKAKDPTFETTKLEWSKKLGEAEMAVLDDPAQHYAQGGGSDLPPGTTVISREDYLKRLWSEFEKQSPSADSTAYARAELKRMESQYAPELGRIVHVSKPGGYLSSEYVWLPNREAPAEEVRGLSRLKGHLQGGQWLTKFRKQIRKSEMSDDMVLVPLPEDQPQEYVRILPTSPP